MSETPTPGQVSKRGTVWDKTGGKCWYCGVKMHPWNDFCIDHVVPSSKGGNGHIGNLVPCCKVCNSRKGQRSLEEYRISIMTANGMIFSPEQADFLHDHGVVIPAPEEPAFYFEGLGLQS